MLCRRRAQVPAVDGGTAERRGCGGAYVAGRPRGPGAAAPPPRAPAAPTPRHQGSAGLVRGRQSYETAIGRWAETLLDESASGRDGTPSVTSPRVYAQPSPELAVSREG